jgi:hypothetical protein
MRLSKSFWQQNKQAGKCLDSPVLYILQVLQRGFSLLVILLQVDYREERQLDAY